MGPSDVESERKEMDAGPSDESTITAMTEKENATGDNTLEERAAEENSVTSEYPRGFRLAVVIIAIIFCVLLLAVDQVSIESSINFFRRNLTFLDNSRYSNTQNY